MDDPETLLATFRETMRNVAATVYAVTTGEVGDRHGILATAVSSLSFDPPSLLVCVNQSASLHAPMGRAGRFCVNVLGRQNRDIASSFSETMGGEARFQAGEWLEIEGVPVLANAQSSLICRQVLRQDFGTHTIFIGELVAARHRAGSIPLVYYDRGYRDIAAIGDETP